MSERYFAISSAIELSPIDRAPVSAEELSAECKKSTRVTVSNSAALVRILDEMGYDYKLLSEGEAEIYAETDLTSLAVALNGADCKLLSYREQNETLESYFINLFGGEGVV